MKKIVALALCLVLALSLCATAFALDSGVIYGYDSTNDAIDNSVATETVVYVAAKDPTATKVGNIAYYKGTLANYVVEDKADADRVLYTGTGYIYLTTTAAVEYGTNPGYVLDYKKGTSVKCGQILATGTYDAAFTKVNGAGKTEYFMATEATTNAATNILVDGVIYAKPVDATATQPHAWTAVTTNATTGAVETVACTACGAKGTVVSQAVWAAAPAAQQSNDFGTLKVLVAAAGTTTTSTVSSAKTFDAGIAMYVGMSIMAVTGSAVVIGKKKEF